MVLNIEQIKKLWKENLTKGHWFQVYIHSPFCQSICNFCAYKGNLFNTEDYNTYYNKYLPSLIKDFSEVIDSREINAFYFGGGTPSLMKATDMENIFSIVPQLQVVLNKYFEIHPAFFDIEKMDILKKFSFQTVIFGIQTFNKDEIKKMNRHPQDFDHIVKLAIRAKELGLKTGIDLLLWEGNLQLYEDLIKAADLGFDVIFSAIDYNIKYVSKEYLDYFIKSIEKFVEVKEYSFYRGKSILECIENSGNIRLYKRGNDRYTQPGVFHYDSVFHVCDNENSSTLALGSYGKQMVLTTSNIGTKIVYQEVNDNWNPRFEIVRLKEPFQWKSTP